MDKGENHQPGFVEEQKDARGILQTDAWTGFEERVEFLIEKSRVFEERVEFRKEGRL